MGIMARDDRFDGMVLWEESVSGRAIPYGQESAARKASSPSLGEAEADVQPLDCLRVTSERSLRGKMGFV